MLLTPLPEATPPVVGSGSVTGIQVVPSHKWIQTLATLPPAVHSMARVVSPTFQSRPGVVMVKFSRIVTTAESDFTSAKLESNSITRIVAGPGKVVS